MNRINCLVATVLCGVLLSCQQEKTPRTVATEFVQQLYGLDFAAAGTLAAPGAQDVLQHARQDLERRVSIDDERGRRSATTADATFETAAFIERTNGSEATVQNNQLSIQVKKEGDEWKVVPTPELVDALVNHPLYLDEAKSAWANLQQNTKSEITWRANTAVCAPAAASGRSHWLPLMPPCAKAWAVK
jgi:1,2-phenylacetyl-CoA epoxidase PaaB subunit